MCARSSSSYGAEPESMTMSLQCPADNDAAQVVMGPVAQLEKTATTSWLFLTVQELGWSKESLACPSGLKRITVLHKNMKEKVKP